VTQEQVSESARVAGEVASQQLVIPDAASPFSESARRPSGRWSSMRISLSSAASFGEPAVTGQWWSPRAQRDLVDHAR